MESRHPALKESAKLGIGLQLLVVDMHACVLRCQELERRPVPIEAARKLFDPRPVRQPDVGTYTQVLHNLLGQGVRGELATRRHDPCVSDLASAEVGHEVDVHTIGGWGPQRPSTPPLVPSEAQWPTPVR